jgi:hypothetical protein
MINKVSNIHIMIGIRIYIYIVKKTLVHILRKYSIKIILYFNLFPKENDNSIRIDSNLKIKQIYVYLLNFYI